MSPYQPPRESLLMIPPGARLPGETIADLVERFERSVQDGLCPVCKDAMLPETEISWYCFGCGYFHELPYPMPFLN